MQKPKLYLLSGSIFLSCSLITPALANNIDQSSIPSTTSAITLGALDIFKPRPSGKSIRIDYSVWDDALDDVILDLGQSTRNRAGKPQAQVGTRMVRGHKSAYRLEGTRFTFAYLNDEYKQGLTDYRKDLEDIGTNYNISELPRNEQLAYWLNLHNVAMIEQIALDYPMSTPSAIKVKIDGEKYLLNDAKFMTIRGQKLSLRDIREKIVYPNWKDPNVIYGFFRGDIGSPMLPRYAYTAADVQVTLTENADDFVNSLRGFNLSSKTRNVSALYEEVAPFYFKNWNSDLQTHLLSHANEEVSEEILTQKPFKIDKYDSMIGDLSGGRRLGASGLANSNSNGNVPFEVARLLTEVRDKKQYLRARGLINTNKGYVIIEDLVPEETTVSTPPPTLEAPE